MRDYLLHFAAFDCETTGLGEDARIVDIAIVLFSGGRPVQQWSSMINPGDIDWNLPSVSAAMQVNGLTREELQDAPTFAETWSTIATLFGWASVFCAHNAQFDLRMLEQEAKRTPEIRDYFGELPVHSNTICTMLADFVHRPGFHKRRLDVAAPAWGVAQEGAHRALGDALTCGRLLCAIGDKMPEELDAWIERQASAAREWEAICQRAASRAQARA